MKREFIENIKTGKYKNCYLKTSEVKATNNSFISNELKLSLTISDDQLINENWEIEIIGLRQYHNLIGISYKPYFNIEIKKDHPLLWNYKYDLIEAELGGMDELKPSAKNSLVGELATLYLNDFGGFVKFETNPISKELKNSEGKRLFFSNQKLFGMVAPILLNYGISSKILKVKSEGQKRWTNTPDAKVMLFRDPFITSEGSLGNCSYIIADDFNFELKNEGNTANNL